ncbi:hypothetical protein ABZ372_48125, partial [Streptomyces sp. NPDC005921]
MTARPATAATATTHRNRTVRISGALCAAVLLTVTAAGCSKKSTDSTSAGSDSSSSSCGTVPAAKFNDSAGLIKALGSEYEAAYSGYSGTVQKSAWANWEGKKSGTITVGISESQLVNPYQTLINTALQKYLKAQGYKVIDLVSTNEVTN